MKRVNVRKTAASSVVLLGFCCVLSCAGQTQRFGQSGDSLVPESGAPRSGSPMPVAGDGDLPDAPSPALQNATGQSSTGLSNGGSGNGGSHTQAVQEVQPGNQGKLNPAQPQSCAHGPCPTPRTNWYERFVDGPKVTPLTPMEKGWLALRNVVDPFNAVTILGDAAISVGADSHSPYGPGMPGFGRYVGVSYTEDITGEFFNTFVICSIAHQDPHYHRMPKASYLRRSLHAITQVVWTQGDNSKGMLNYANLIGFGIDDEIANLYVPNRETNARASAQRYATGLASAPIGNFISEFLPDVASHIHVQIVVVQRIINQVANKEAAGQ